VLAFSTLSGKIQVESVTGSGCSTPSSVVPSLPTTPILFVVQNAVAPIKRIRAPLGFFVISDKEPKRRSEPKVLKIPHASGILTNNESRSRAK
jgi:hypothetical protein